MRKLLLAVGLMATLVVASLSTVSVAAQQPPPAPGVKPPPPQNVPLELQVVISRYQGDKRVSSLPYVLSLKSSGQSTRFAPGYWRVVATGFESPDSDADRDAGHGRQAGDDHEFREL